MAETEPTFYFPFSAFPILNSYNRFTINDTIIETAFSGVEQRMDAYPDPGYERFSLTTKPFTPGAYATDYTFPASHDKLKELLNFLSLCRGRRNNFWFFPYDFEFFPDVVLGTLAGGELATPLAYRLADDAVKATPSGPAAGTGFYSFKVGGVTQVYGTDYLAYNGGVYNTDLTFNSGSIINSQTTLQWLGGGAPAGEMVASFFGTPRLVCRLDSDVIQRRAWVPVTIPYAIQFDLSFREVR